MKNKNKQYKYAYVLTEDNRKLIDFLQGIEIDEKNGILWSEQNLHLLGLEEHEISYQHEEQNILLINLSNFKELLPFFEIRKEYDAVSFSWCQYKVYFLGDNRKRKKAFIPLINSTISFFLIILSKFFLFNYLILIVLGLQRLIIACCWIFIVATAKLITISGSEKAKNAFKNYIYKIDG